MFEDNTGARSGQEHIHVCCSIPESVQWDLCSASAQVRQQSLLAPHRPAAVAADAGTTCHQHEQWPECQDSGKAPGTCTPMYQPSVSDSKSDVWHAHSACARTASRTPHDLLQCMHGRQPFRVWQQQCRQLHAIPASTALAQVVHTCTKTHLAAGPAVPILSTGYSMPVDASQTCIWPFS